MDLVIEAVMLPRKTETDKNIDKLDIQCDVIEKIMQTNGRVSNSNVKGLIITCRRLIESYYKEL